MNSRYNEEVQKLFEFWCEIRPATAGEKASGYIISSFPEKFKDPEIITKIPDFAYPCNFTNDSLQLYSFVLTSSDSKWRFGFCRHDPRSGTAMVLITYLPWHDTFIRFMNVLGELKKSDGDEFQPFLSEAYNRGVPEPGASLKLFYNSGTNNFMFQRPSQFQLPSIPENHNLNLYYNFVDARNMISVFAAMLAERRIVFTSHRFDRLSSCVQAANAFLYPMVWQHIFIPILPMKMREILCAPMPFLIGVPEAVLKTMTRDELGEVVVLNCDNKTFDSPFDDVKSMPQELVSQLKKQLSNPSEHIGDRVSKIFLGILVQLIGGYRDAIKFTQGDKITWDRDTFIDSRAPSLRPFLRNMMELQIFQQFIEERLDMLNTGLGFSDEFELETLRHSEKTGRKGMHYKGFLKNVKDKQNKSNDTTPNLINLEANTSFELEDFDPLNKNAKPMPPPKTALVASSSQSLNRVPLPGLANPMYPYYTPQRQMPLKKPQNRTNDDDVELLRKYGLDQFSLVDDCNMGASGSSQSNGSMRNSSDRNNWTVFD
ncbi:DENN domain-containing protein 1A isoform X8 [Bradysia coprophila]|uniref:DENN domain-containing protein 1A isoform X8 n=1 Tax=Bradysia coprophila TaxID=38358 RepID=UPI00187D90FA|nr:DENN domain-containing protein 1A isoform X8 [Bradysia coprophila]